MCAERCIAFIVHGGGQNNVHVVVGFITVEVVRCAGEVHVLDGFCINLGLRPNHDVKAESDHAAEFAVLDVFRQLVRVELNLSVIPNRNEVFVETVFLVSLEPVVINEVFCEAVVVDDIAFRTDTEESTSGDIDVTQDCGDVQQSACAVDAVSGVRKRLRSQSEASRAFGVHTSGLNDKVGRNAGNGFGLFRCEVFAVISVLFNAVNPLVAEGLVVQTFFEEDAADTGA